MELPWRQILRYCKKCGQPVLTPPAYTPSSSPVPSSAANIPAQPGNRSGANKWLIGGLVGAGLVAALVCVVAVAGIAIFRTTWSTVPPTQVVNRPPSTQTDALLASPTVEILATAAVPEEVTPSPLPPGLPRAIRSTPELKLTTYNSEGVTFSYDPVLGTGVEMETVEAQTSADLPPWELAPQYTRLTFTGYPFGRYVSAAADFHLPRSGFLYSQPKLW